MTRILFRGLAVGFLLASSGCFVNVDLTTTPNPVAAGQPVTMKVKVTNPLQCPVGEVFALLVPFVPKDHLIDKIHDPHLRHEASEALDAFCSGEPVSADLPAVACTQVGAELVCTIGMGDMAVEAPLAVATTTTGEQVTCESTGSTIVCRIPTALVQRGNQVAEDATTNQLPDPFPFECTQIDGVFVCGTLSLFPGQMKMDEVVIPAPVDGMYRNFVITIATRRGGVCKSVPFLPCSIDSQCGIGECGSGICSTGKLTFGCDANADCNLPGVCIAGKCLGTNTSCSSSANCTVVGTCTQCDPGDGEFLPGVACTNSLVQNPATAPAMSSWGLGITAAALMMVAMFALRRARAIS